MSTETISLAWAAAPTSFSSCSKWTCLAGHKYPVSLQIVECPACKTPFIAVKLHNCPYCNEPPAQLSTTIVLAPSQTLTPPCHKETPNAAQSVEVLIDYVPKPFTTDTLGSGAATSNTTNCPSCSSGIPTSTPSPESSVGTEPGNEEPKTL